MNAMENEGAVLYCRVCGKQLVGTPRGCPGHGFDEISQIQALLDSEIKDRKIAETESTLWHQMAEKCEKRAQSAERELHSVTLEWEEAERQRNASQEESCSLSDENNKLKKQVQKGHCDCDWFTRDDVGLCPKCDAQMHATVKKARKLDGETILALQERVEELDYLRGDYDIQKGQRRRAERVAKERLIRIDKLEELAQTAVDTYKINHAEDCCVGDAIDALDAVLLEGVRDEEVPEEEWVKDIPEVLKLLRKEGSIKRQRAGATLSFDLKTRLLKETNRFARFCEWVEKAHSAELKKEGECVRNETQMHPM